MQLPENPETHQHISQRNEDFHPHKNLYINFTTALFVTNQTGNDPGIFHQVNG